MLKNRGATEIENNLIKLECPYCGYKMPVFKGEDAKCKDIWIKCKNPKCKQIFEIKIESQRLP